MNRIRRLDKEVIAERDAYEKKEEIESSQENLFEKKKWHQKTWVRAVAFLLAMALVITELISRLASGTITTTVAGLQPQVLLDGEIVELLENPMDVIAKIKKAEFAAKKEQQEIQDACVKAETLIAEGNYEGALEQVDFLMENADLTEDNLSEMKKIKTALFFSSGQFEEARKGCTEFIEADQDENGYYHFIRSVCDIQEEKFESAREDILKAMEMGYEDPALCYVHLAFCENYLEDYEKVLEYTNQALELDADEVYRLTLIYLQAVASLKLEHFDESITYIDTLLQEEAYEKDHQLYYYRGVSWLTKEEYQKAYDDFQKAFEYGEETSLLYYNRGVAALGLNKLEEAENNLEEVIKRGDEKNLIATAEEILSLLRQQSQMLTE